MEWITNPEIWISLVTLTLLEIVLGIDNIVFISILASKLPKDQQIKARQTGLALALITRVLLLMGLAWMARLTNPLFHIPQVLGMDAPHPVSGRDLILFLGGLFLLGKSTHEIHDKLEGEDGQVTKRLPPTFASVIVQILLLDIVFSLDSVITAIGMARQVPVMVTAVVLAMIFMLFFSGYISAFIDKHPTLKMLALSFLILIGCMLVAEGFHKTIPKGYIYFAMAFAVGVEALNIRLRSKAATRVELHQPYR
ncbi:MAG: TerC family protein [Verrucomicrobiota bacterium]|jgi:predicted tellurium resistance membrane protein TerC